MSHGCATNGVIGYAYDADLHCVECTEKRFGADALEADASGLAELTDSEGNPLHPIFLWDENLDESACCCGDCSEAI